MPCSTLAPPESFMKRNGLPVFQRELDQIGHLGAMYFPSSATRNREILADKLQGASIASGATSDNPIGRHVLACDAEQRSPVLGKDADFLKARVVD